MTLEEYTNGDLTKKITGVKLKIPQDGSVEMLCDKPPTEAYLVSLHSKPGGWFMSVDPPDAPTRSLIPTYGNPGHILKWEVVT